MLVRKLRGLTQGEFQAVKADVANIQQKLTLRYHRQHYCYGSIDIRPTKADRWELKPETLGAIKEVMKNHSLTITVPAHLESPNAPYIFHNGVCYIKKLERIENGNSQNS